MYKSESKWSPTLLSILYQGNAIQHTCITYPVSQATDKDVFIPKVSGGEFWAGIVCLSWGANILRLFASLSQKVGYDRSLKKMHLLLLPWKSNDEYGSSFWCYGIASSFLLSHICRDSKLWVIFHYNFIILEGRTPLFTKSNIKLLIKGLSTGNF